MPRQSRRPRRRDGARRQLRAIAPLRLIVRLVRDWATPSGRALRVLQRDHGDWLLQPSPTTKRNRHPDFFAYVRQQLEPLSSPSILSYGCSTGEEALSLADYLPQARLDAVDINPRSIAVARAAGAREGKAQIRFICAPEPPLDAIGAYDAIFCLSVLRHGLLDAEEPQDCSAILPFSRFADVVAALDRCLKPGGLLVLWGCNFRFDDTATAAHYRLRTDASRKPQGGVFYGPDNQRLTISTYNRFVFEKMH